MLLDHRHDGAWIDEAGEVVDVPMRVVAGDAASEPEDIAHAEVVRERPLQRVPRQAGVPRLRLAQQTLLRREQRPASVHVDGPALEDDINLPLPSSETTRDPVPDRVVALPVRVLRPGVE